MSEERLVELETKVAFQEHTIQELSDVIYRQQLEIDKLVATTRELKTDISTFSEQQGEESSEQELPPHY